jgi:hypothetical protein
VATERAKGWIIAFVFSASMWTLVLMASHELLSLWDEQQQLVAGVEDESAA